MHMSAGDAAAPARLVAVVLLSLLTARVCAQDAGTGFRYGVAAGDVTDTAAIVWTRADTPGAVTLEVATDPGFSTILQTVAVEAVTADDLTIKVEVEGLEPATVYHYRFRRQDEPSAVSRTGTFVTAPAPDSSQGFSFAFSGDNSSLFAPFHLFANMAQDRPDFFIYGGDTVYADLSGEVVSTLPGYRGKYREIRDDPYLREFLAGTAVWAMWDDHEVLNNYAGATDPAVAEYVHEAYQAFFEYMPIRPSEGFRTYRSIRYGELAEIFLLDTRQYRSPSAIDACGSAFDPSDLLVGPLNPDCLDALADPTRTMLGPEQLAWLLEGLISSTARWKFIVSSVPMTTFGLIPYDNWESYAAERNAILRFIADNGLQDEVVILAADAHLNAHAPNVAHYIQNTDPDALPAGFEVPEFIAGPIGTATFRQEIVRYAPQLIGLPSDWPLVQIPMQQVFRRAMRRLRKINDLAFLQPNRYGYLLVHVTPDELRFECKGIRPDTTEPVEAATLYQTSIPPSPTDGVRLPCAAIGLVPALALGLAARRFLTIC